MNDFPAEFSLQSAPIGPVQLALFAAASGDHNPLHLDPDVARAAGFERPVVHGMLTMALAGRLFTRQFGHGSVRVLQTRFTGVALSGDTVMLVATLEQADASSARYTLRGVSSRGNEVVVGHAEVMR